MRGNALGRGFGEFYGVPYVLTVNSGTAAYLAALLALRLPSGSEVVLPALGWPQLRAPLPFLNLNAVFADCNRDGRVTAESVVRAVSPRTSAVVLCHLLGNPSEAKAIAQVCDARGIALIEDCSQALLAADGGRRVGTFGAFGFASLGRGKLLTAGEGGLLWTHDPTRFERALALSQHPEDARNPGEEQAILLQSLSLRMHPRAIEDGARDLETFAQRSEAVSARHEVVRDCLRAGAIPIPEVGIGASPRWTHLALLPDPHTVRRGEHLWSRRFPACVISESRTPFASRFARKVRFIESGRRWEKDDRCVELALQIVHQRPASECEAQSSA